MNAVKQVLADIPSCYSVVGMEMDGRPQVLFASEADDRCLMFDIEDLSASPETVWEHPGGTMGMVPIPGKANEFLAIQKFYRLWDWDQSMLVWCRRTAARQFEVTPVVTLPYLHRFDLIQSGDDLHLIICCVAKEKSALDDWHSPGVVYGAPLPEHPGEQLDLKVLHDGLFKNHGYAQVGWKGRQVGFVTTDSGAFLFTPPEARDGDWTCEKLMDGNFSDGDMCDIDGDGELEIATIEPFHGDRFCVYKRIDGAYRKVFQAPGDDDFYHVVKAANLCGRPGFLGGGRGGKQQLFFLTQAAPGAPFQMNTIDEGQGPSNAFAARCFGKDMVFSSNRNVGQAVVYHISDAEVTSR